jgi:hypothetical protein
MLDQPGVFTYRDAVAIIQLVPFTTLRVLAACFQLASIHEPTDSVYGGALICQGIGLAPATLLNIGLFVRV